MEAFVEDAKENLPRAPRKKHKQSAHLTDAQIRAEHLEKREVARKRAEEDRYRHVVYEGDNPSRQVEGMSREEIKVHIAERLLNGERAEDIAKDLHWPITQVLGRAKDTAINIRLQKIQNHLCTNVLKKKGPVLKAISGMSLVALAEWVFEFVETNQHLTMKVGEAAQFMKLTLDINNLRRLEAGKVTSRTEVIQKAEKKVEDIIETLTSANIEDGGDPFRDYGETD